MDWTHSAQNLQEFINWLSDQALNFAKMMVPVVFGLLGLWIKKLYEKAKAEGTMANLDMTKRLVQLNVAKVEEKKPGELPALKHEAVKQAVLPKAGDAVKPVVDVLVHQAVKDMNTAERGDVPGTEVR